MAKNIVFLSVSTVVNFDDSDRSLIYGAARQNGRTIYRLVQLCTSFNFSGNFLLFVCHTSYSGWRSLQSARHCPLVHLEGKQVRLLNTAALFAGQIGFWQPELVVSQGLLQTLSPNHVESVLAHEQGHFYYRDTFWFFWLGWVRSCTAWLPNTDALWQELLVLRELRADSYAASQVDPLLLAESLLLVVSNGSVFSQSEICCAALGDSVGDRLEQRIEALLAPPNHTPEAKFPSWHGAAALTNCHISHLNKNVERSVSIQLRLCDPFSLKNNQNVGCVSARKLSCTKKLFILTHPTNRQIGIVYLLVFPNYLRPVARLNFSFYFYSLNAFYFFDQFFSLF